MRRIGIETLISIKKIRQKVEIVEGKLVISLINKDQSIYSLRNEIDSVQGNKIIYQNICKYKKILNENQNWDSLKVIVKH